jgi:hypothetical protein
MGGLGGAFPNWESLLGWLTPPLQRKGGPATRAKTQSTLSKEQLERFNRASDHYRNILNLWQDRLALEGESLVEQYCRERFALILHCEILSVEGIERKHAFPTSIGNKNGLIVDDAFVVLKANTVNESPLKHWNNELVFVPDIQIVQGPDGVIPSFVGLYRVEHKLVDKIGDLLLFQSIIQSGYQFISRIADQKASVVRGNTVTFPDNIVPENVQSAAEIVKRIADNEGGFLYSQCTRIKVNRDPISMLRVSLNTNSVMGYVAHPHEQSIKVTDVLLGPFNLAP